MLFKRIAVVLILLTSLQVSAQKIKKLTYTAAGDSLKPDDAIIYSDFTPPNFAMGTGVAEIGLYNIDTKEYFQFQAVSGTSLKSKNIIFCYHINPGKYQLAYMLWNDFHGLYYKVRSGLLHKNVSYADSAANNVRGLIKGLVTDTTNRYTFTVKAGTLYYLGRWDFSKGTIKFSDAKNEIDTKMKRDFSFLKFDEAVTELPE